MNPSDFDPELDDLYNKAAGRLLTSDSFDVTAFARMYEYLCQKAELIKADHAVSKQVVMVIFSTQRAIERAAPYNSQAKAALPLAGKFSMLLELIAIGESPGDRPPGVPRIV